MESERPHKSKSDNDAVTGADFQERRRGLKLDQELEEIRLHGVLLGSGVREKVLLLRERIARLQQEIRDAAGELAAQEKSQEQINDLKLQIKGATRELRNLELQRQEIELELGVQGWSFFGTSKRHKALIKMKEQTDEKIAETQMRLKTLEQKKVETERDSESKVISLSRKAVDAQAEGQPEDAASTLREQVQEAQAAVDNAAENQKTLAHLQNQLAVAEKAEKQVQMSVETKESIGAYIQAGKPPAEAERAAKIEHLRKQIAEAPGELEKRQLELDLAKLNDAHVPADAATGTTESRSEACVKPAPLKPATWEQKEAKGEWCPDHIKPHLPYVPDKYENNIEAEIPVLPAWKSIVATRRGKMHAHHGTHREDAFGVENGPHFTVACVSDGAGSYQYSRIGSETTCREMTRLMKDSLLTEANELDALEGNALATALGAILQRSVIVACESLRSLATKSGAQPKDFRCTLLAAILYKSEKSGLALACQVGDGFIAGLKVTGSAARYGSSDSGEFSGEVNCFIPDESAPTKATESIAAIRAISLADLEALILCSDGIEDPFYPIDKKAAPIFEQLYSGVAAPLDGFTDQPKHGPVIGVPNSAELLGQWLSFEKKGENDDRTILVLHRDSISVDPAKIVNG